MSRRRRLIAASVIAGVSLAGIGGAAAAGGKSLSTDLNGVEEAPGPGDANATGHADITVKPGKNEVCYDLSWAAIDGTVLAAHIHVAPPGFAGQVVVPLFSGALAGTDEASGCIDVDAALVKAIRKDPAAYYVNVHSTIYPAGAIRGQLGD